MSQFTFVNWELLPAGVNPGSGIAPLATDPVLIDRKISTGAEVRIVACFAGPPPYDTLQSLRNDDPSQVRSVETNGSQTYVVFQVGVRMDLATRILARHRLMPQP